MSGLKCPNCGAATAFTPIFLGSGRVLGFIDGTREAAHSTGVVPAVMKVRWEGIQYALLCCQECGRLFAVADSSNSEGWRVVHPIPHKPASNKIPEPIRGEFEEASLCFAVRAYRACAAMCQITLESLWQNKKVSGLNQLRDDGIISQRLFDRATEIRLWGDIVKHEPIAESVSKDDAEELLTYLEDILNHVYVEQARYEAFKQKRKRIEESAKK
ncbi:MAG: DUF4145 domain-containing protein [Dehalococcoidia bacterium]|nr:MAG: DUF4145 domain-containing protein [Dehalococcoidia bacterium]